MTRPVLAPHELRRLLAKAKTKPQLADIVVKLRASLVEARGIVVRASPTPTDWGRALERLRPVIDTALTEHGAGAEPFEE